MQFKRNLLLKSTISAEDIIRPTVSTSHDRGTLKHACHLFWNEPLDTLILSANEQWRLWQTYVMGKFKWNLRKLYQKCHIWGSFSLFMEGFIRYFSLGNGLSVNWWGGGGVVLTWLHIVEWDIKHHTQAKIIFEVGGVGIWENAMKPDH